jgi:F-type H+-transporting ATPase subunit beta
MSKNGKIVQVIGAVVDAAFPLDSVPEIFDAITIAYTIDGNAQSLTLEVQQHLGEGLVRAVAMTSTDGLVRGMDVVATGAPISVPVGEAVLGRFSLW